MPSPFPGMDPWLEAPGLFPDLHNTFIGHLRDAMNAGLPRPYYTALGTRLYIEESDRQVEPDVDVFAPKKRPKFAAVGGARGGVAVATARKAKPVVMRVASDEVREWTLEIRHSTADDRLVTSVEVLSLANKARGSTGRKLYLKKRKELMRGKVNVVEIDLLRDGEPTTLAPLLRVARKVGPFAYHACVRRSYRALSREVYPIPLDDPLPAVAIPLLKGDPDVTVDLQEVFAKSYDIARFDQRAKYGVPPVPPLTKEQQAWADELLTARRTG